MTHHVNSIPFAFTIYKKKNHDSLYIYIYICIKQKLSKVKFNAILKMFSIKKE